MLSDKSSYEDQISRIVCEVIRYGSNFQNIRTLIEKPIFVTSHVHSLIQIADACAYCIMKHYSDSKIFANYWYAINNKLRKASNGDTTGYGLKIFP